MVDRCESGLRHQPVDSLGAAVMILVVHLQDLFGDVFFGDPTGGNRFKNLLRTDRVKVVEMFNGLEAEILVHGGVSRN